MDEFPSTDMERAHILVVADLAESRRSYEGVLPDVTRAAPDGTDRAGHAFTIRVLDCRAAYETLRSRGGEFFTSPYDWGSEIRCLFRDPDDHLFEISEIPTRGSG